MNERRKDDFADDLADDVAEDFADVFVEDVAFRHSCGRLGG